MVDFPYIIHNENFYSGSRKTKKNLEIAYGASSQEFQVGPTPQL